MGEGLLGFAVSFSLVVLLASGVAYAGPNAFQTHPALLSILGQISSFFGAIGHAIASALGIAPKTIPVTTALPITSVPTVTVSTTVTTVLTTEITLGPQECNTPVTIYVGESLNCSSYSVQLNAVYTQPPINGNNLRYQAGVHIFYNGSLVNASLLYQGSTKSENISGHIIYVNIVSVYDGASYSGKYADINVSNHLAAPPPDTVSSTVSTTLSTTTMNYTCGSGVNHCFYGSCPTGYTCESGMAGVGEYCPEHIGYVCVQTSNTMT